MFLIPGGSKKYEIQKSLRLRATASAYLSRTFGTPTNRKKSTISLWFKRGALGRSVLFSGLLTSTDRAILEFDDSNRLRFDDYASAQQCLKVSNDVFREVAAAYHVVMVIDTDNAVAEDRLRLYVQNRRITSWASSVTYSAGFLAGINGPTRAHYIGQTGLPSGYADGYLSEINFIDGQALDPSYFGKTDPATDQWVPKKYNGTYGTNGFYLPFSDGASLTTLGYDKSGNGNNWTLNNISLTAGASYDWMDDTPTNSYSTLDPLSKWVNSTLPDGNLGCVVPAGNFATTKSTQDMLSGQWYCEVIPVSGDGFGCGVCTSAAGTSYLGSDAYGWNYTYNAQKWNSNAGVAYGATWTLGDVIGVAFDADAGTLTFYKNGVSQGVAYSGLPSGPYFFAISDGGNAGSTTMAVNFGQRPFSYTPPAGFKALCTKNLPEPPILQPKKHFEVKLHTGNNTTQNITGVEFQPDFAWVKSRSNAYSHILNDSVRGAGKLLTANTAGSESGNAGDLISSFNSNGITVNTTYQGAANASTNGLDSSYVDWLWKAGGAAGANTSGTTTSQVSANTTAGFSIVAFDLQATGSKTVGHGLGVAPEFIIMKGRNATGSQPKDWFVYHAGAGAGKYLTLNSTAAAATNSTSWDNTAPTSSVFTVGSGFTTGNYGTNQIAYCFAEVPGFSKFGSYVGNGSSDGPFVHCGFKPRYLLIKLMNGNGGDWLILDTARDPINEVKNFLYGDLYNAEGAGDAGLYRLDVVSNGFKIRGNGTQFNASGYTYIYAAFAEAPFKYANAR